MPSFHLLSALLFVLLQLFSLVDSRNCTITGGNFGFSVDEDANSLTCDATDACQGATISGCDSIICGDRDCTGATITDSGNVLCKGESGCRQATIGTVESPVNTVTCQGDSWTCYEATMVANTTIVCRDDSGSGEINANGVCGFADITTPCLQCIGTNHGCGGGNGCEMNGNDCPEFRYGGTSCEAACPEGESCPVNETLPNGDDAPSPSAGVRSSWLGSFMIGFFMTIGLYVNENPQYGMNQLFL